jgi:hypothetical protein
MEQPLRRIVRRLLAQTPRMYRAALRIFRQRFIEKHLWIAVVLCPWEELRGLA